MDKIRLFGFRRQVFCDRCSARLDGAFVTLCDDCFRVPPEHLRPMDIPFTDTDHKICAICARQYARRDLKPVCMSCSARHPDTTHANFGRNRESIFAQCDRCGGLQVAEQGPGEARFTYFRTGTRQPLPGPFVCPAAAGSCARDIQSSCTHDWLLVQSLPPEADEPLEHDAARIFLTQEQLQALRESVKAGTSTWWCTVCGAVTHAHRHAADHV